MDAQTIDFILRIVQVVVLPILAFLIKLLLDQRKQLYSLDCRLTKAESRLQTVPSEKAMHELALTIRSFGGDLHVAVERIEGVGRIVDRLERVVTRHEDFLLNNGGK
jgi:hypothetical protein